MIGHPRPETIRALRDAQSLWREEGIRMISVAAFLGMPGGKEKRIHAQNSNSEHDDRKDTVK
jgi:polysaccharide deacetylase 2 family uncharacterized protein YibQ